MSKKDVYEIFNDVEFDFDDIEEVEMNDIEKKRISNNTKKKLKLNKKPFRKTAAYKAALILVAAGITFTISPIGREALAEVGRKLFFTPSNGVINGESLGETYTLSEPFRIELDGNSFLVKSIISSTNSINIELNNTDEDLNIDVDDMNKEELIAESQNKFESLKNSVTIVTNDGITKEVDSMSASSGGFYWLNFAASDEIISSFNLCWNDKSISEINLNKVNYADNIDDLGNSSQSSDITVCATEFYQEDERYFKLWSPIVLEENNDLQTIFYGQSSDKDIIVTDSNGNKVNFERYEDGTGKAYKITDDYSGPLHINIIEIELGYRFNKAPELSTKLPKDGESLDINKTVSFPGIKDTILVKDVTESDGTYTFTLDYSKNYDSNRNIYMVMPGFRSAGGTGDPENSSGEIYIDKEDLKLNEKIFNNINLSLMNVDMNISGNWNILLD